MIEAVHTAVPGRARFKVEGLAQSPLFQSHLESTLLDQEEISSAKASSITGTVLIHFNSGNDLSTISLLLDQLTARIRDEIQNGNLHAPPLNPRSPRRAPVEEGPGWHRMSVKKVISMIEGNPDQGLDQKEVASRRREHGPNSIVEQPARTGWSILMEQFTSLPVALLGGAAVLSLATGGVLDAVVIGGVVVANSLIGYLTEYESERTIASFQVLGQPTSQVIRQKKLVEIPAEELVPGDLVALNPGSFVGADLRIIQSERLCIDESALTGESQPVTKKVPALAPKGLPLAERVNMAFKGTLVTGGNGRGIVVGTGANTEMGRLQLLLTATTPPRPPIEGQLSRTGDQLVQLCGAMCGVVFFAGLARGIALLEMLRISVSLAAAAIPEGLPAAATTTFSLGIMDMRKHGVLVRRLHAVETLGAVKTVCFDKTGTITENRMSVAQVFVGGKLLDAGSDSEITPSREEVDLLLNVCVLCSEVKLNGSSENKELELQGSPTENALVRLANSRGLDVKTLRKTHPLHELKPRTENFPAMRSLHETKHGTYLQAVKGSPMVVLSLCDRWMKNGEIVPLEEKDLVRIETENDDMAGRAYRVLGIAYREENTKADADTEEGLVWLGLIGLSDPIRPGVDDLIKLFHQAGIRTILITGDQSLTAYAVAERLNLSKGEPPEILESSRLSSMDEQTLNALAEKVHVFSRVTPAHKLEIVKALQSTGTIVAMTGDGINDSPALKAADVGIAMGRGGTDVAREVADVILEQDDLETLILAVRDGRTIYGNIRKSVHFFLSTNFSEIMVMLGSVLSGIGSPLNTMQLLWINLISDIFPGLALSLEPPEPDVLERQPRDPQANLFSGRDYRNMTWEAGLISAGSMAAYLWGLARYGAGAKASTLAFQSLTTAQLLHAWTCRSSRHSIFGPEKLPPNPKLNLAVGASLAIQGLTQVVPGLKRLLGLAPLGPIDLAVAFGSAALSFGANEWRK